MNIILKSRFSPVVLALLAGCITTTVLSGCGSGGGPDPKVEASRFEKLKGMRDFYNKVNGDYNQLTGPDKAAFIKLAGDETKAQDAWSLMKNGPGAATHEAPGGSAPPQQGR